MLRTQSAFLAAILTASLVTSCGGADSAETTSAGSTGADGTTGTTTAGETSSAYPELEAKNLGGKSVNILIRSEWDYEFKIDEETGDNVSDAIFKRNRSVEDNYNCKLNFIDFKGDWSNHEDFTNIIHNSVLAGDGAYDFIAGYQAVLTTNVQNGDLMNLYDVPNLQLDAPWWTQEGVEALTYSGKCYEVGGDIAVSLLEGINCMFYNKTLAENYNSPDFYELVNSGKWTHDAMLAAAKDVYKDLNANDAKDEADQFGFITQQNFIRPYAVTYETPTISKSGEIVWNNEHTVSVVEKLADLFVTDDNMYFENSSISEKVFSNGRALLINSSLGAASRLRSMDDDFGIIPYPKFDESQDSYHTTTSNEVSMICVPVTAADPATSGFVIEALCRTSTDTVAKSFYDVALKGKYTRDDNSAEMIDLIRNSLTFDFGWVASMATGVSGAQYEIMSKSADKNFASWYAANEAVIKDKVSQYLTVYESGKAE